MDAYDEDGLSVPDMSAAVNSSGRPERILSAEQARLFDQLVDGIMHQPKPDQQPEE